MGRGHHRHADDEEHLLVGVCRDHLVERHVRIGRSDQQRDQAGRLDIDRHRDPPVDHPEEDAEAEARVERPEDGQRQRHQEERRARQDVEPANAAVGKFEGVPGHYGTVRVVSHCRAVSPHRIPLCSSSRIVLASRRFFDRGERRVNATSDESTKIVGD
jgi:hypothetical protein